MEWKNEDNSLIISLILDINHFSLESRDNFVAASMVKCALRSKTTFLIILPEIVASNNFSVRQGVWIQPRRGLKSYKIARNEAFVSVYPTGRKYRSLIGADPKCV